MPVLSRDTVPLNVTIFIYIRLLICQNRSLKNITDVDYSVFCLYLLWHFILDSGKNARMIALHLYCHSSDFMMENMFMLLYKHTLVEICNYINYKSLNIHWICLSELILLSIVQVKIFANTSVLCQHFLAVSREYMYCIATCRWFVYVYPFLCIVT
jgi:hypothetical protein